MAQDALDVLRTWIAKNLPYGQLRPLLVIHEGRVHDVYISRGDERIHLRAENKVKEENGKPHF